MPTKRLLIHGDLLFDLAALIEGLLAELEIRFAGLALGLAYGRRCPAGLLIGSGDAALQVNDLPPRIQQLGAIMAQIGEAKKGMAIALDWDGKATRLIVEGKPAGQPIPGEDFYRALLRIWVGDKPVQDDLKKKLLGG